MKAEALERVSIRWLPDPAYEDTKTIALNVGGYFMDLRVTIATSTIEWAQAGERTILKQEPRTCRWTHIIDSLDLTEPDEAQLFKLPDGNELEVGATQCPFRGGAMTPFEEVWRNVTVHDLPDDRSWILQSCKGTTFIGKVGNICLALRKDKEVGFVARREELSQVRGSWEITYESGDVSSLPRVTQVVQGLCAGDQSWNAGDNVAVGDVEYTIRAFDEN